MHPPPPPSLPTMHTPARQKLTDFEPLVQVMEHQLIDEASSFWDDNFPGLVRERQVGVFTHVLSVVFVRGAFLYGLSEASTHGRCIIDNNNEVTYVTVGINGHYCCSLTP